MCICAPDAFSALCVSLSLSASSLLVRNDRRDSGGRMLGAWKEEAAPTATAAGLMRASNQSAPATPNGPSVRLKSMLASRVLS